LEEEVIFMPTITTISALVFLFVNAASIAAEMSDCQKKNLEPGQYLMKNSRMTGSRAEHELVLMQSPYAHITPIPVSDGLFSVTRYKGVLEKGQLDHCEGTGGCDYHAVFEKYFELSRICDVARRGDVECYDVCAITTEFSSSGGGDCR